MSEVREKLNETRLDFEELIKRIVSDMAFEELVPFYEMCDLEREYQDSYAAKLRTKTIEELQLIHRDRQNETLTEKEQERLDKAMGDLP